MQASTKSKTTNPEFFETNQLMKKSNNNKQTGLFLIGQKILKGSDPYFRNWLLNLVRITSEPFLVYFLVHLYSNLVSWFSNCICI